jgi:hypothetical protein
LPLLPNNALVLLFITCRCFPFGTLIAIQSRSLPVNHYLSLLLIDLITLALANHCLPFATSTHTFRLRFLTLPYLTRDCITLTKERLLEAGSAIDITFTPLLLRFLHYITFHFVYLY